MRDESAEFDAEDIAAFQAALVEQDRLALVDRLERASARLREMVPQVRDQQPSDGVAWNAREVLAHIAVLSKFYGVLAYRVGSGAVESVDLMGQVRLRDAAAGQLAALPASAVAEAALGDQERTLRWLRSASAEQLMRRADLGGGQSWSAGDVLRLPLLAHLELHLEQLEQELTG